MINHENNNCYFSKINDLSGHISKSFVPILSCFGTVEGFSLDGILGTSVSFALLGVESRTVCFKQFMIWFSSVQKSQNMQFGVFAAPLNGGRSGAEIGWSGT